MHGHSNINIFVCLSIEHEFKVRLLISKTLCIFFILFLLTVFLFCSSFEALTIFSIFHWFYTSINVFPAAFYWFGNPSSFPLLFPPKKGSLFFWWGKTSAKLIWKILLFSILEPKTVTRAGWDVGCVFLCRRKRNKKCRLDKVNEY